MKRVVMDPEGGASSACLLNILELWRELSLGVLVLEVLLVGLGVRHQRLADSTRRLQCRHSRLLLVIGVVTGLLLHLGLLLSSLLLGLNLLLPTSHFRSLLMK
eukprot:TRINITY_DN32568_c1_g1_i1.p1 TRINITY_DN32568_c1_g1~~TRINITY_DN32568_c1_g1_i1.p1  ORF type:complete len:103 (-),score=11.78 TRINITY_DN32568_c1_g1_i1:8-316(-)